MKKVIEFVKKETVLVVAWILAFVSMIFVHPSEKYLSYIDIRTLGILWCLMVIMEGLQWECFFENVGNRLLTKTRRVWQLVIVLVFLCFFSGMLITNDVALITFVPFAMMSLRECKREDLLIPIITLQTLAANLGSMLTPIGNPQNIYLYGLLKTSVWEFVKIMLPYSCVTMVLLLISIFLIKNARDEICVELREMKRGNKRNRYLYLALFGLALFVVMGKVPYWILIIITLFVVGYAHAYILVKVDYALLLTFVGFFIFTGNISNISHLREMLTEMVQGREVLGGILTSQIISNVPAALLLSPFTSDIKRLVVGVNLGGMGTLIASMASLISYKLLAHRHNELKGKYIGYFTIMSILYLMILLGLNILMSMMKLNV